MKKGQYVDLTGNRFGQLVALERIPPTSDTRSKWVCKCDCGNVATVSVSNLRNGHTTSCGCAVVNRCKDTHTKHGGKKKHEVDRLYAVWRAMKQRCQRSKNPAYKYYGGRGITVCSEWQDYKSFKEWAYKSGYDETAERGECTIDRIDPNGNYEPTNCRWVDMKTQNNNKRKVVEDNNGTDV
jgi:hypothetical protein